MLRKKWGLTSYLLYIKRFIDKREMLREVERGHNAKERREGKRKGKKGEK